ncbi:UNVERIFIED_CONTAM: Cell division cycle 5-like protein [Sesamum calycinum]|uniref:Cell division cycle 5-like protein n=1 Tax=Sesamum calycinum TaxID=2727403 RepID=A0AAW2JJ10_9LAMI
MSDRIAREKAEEEARQQALLKKRSKVLQRELPRPPPASLDLIRNSLIRADEDKSSFVPPTLEKKKGGKRAANGKSVSVPPIDEFEENELKEADELIKDEAELLRVAMGHENESLDGYLKHTRDINDMMYFHRRLSVLDGLSSEGELDDHDRYAILGLWKSPQPPEMLQMQFLFS